MSRTRSFLAVAVAAGFLAAGLVFTPVPSTFAKDVAVAASAKDDAKKKAAEERAMKKKAAAVPAPSSGTVTCWRPTRTRSACNEASPLPSAKRAFRIVPLRSKAGKLLVVPPNCNRV